MRSDARSAPDVTDLRVPGIMPPRKIGSAPHKPSAFLRQTVRKRSRSTVDTAARSHAGSGPFAAIERLHREQNQQVIRRLLAVCDRGFDAIPRLIGHANGL